MTSPADTIREALDALYRDASGFHDEYQAALAALTELEQQAAAKEGEWVRKPMWDAMLARAEAAEADRDRLADTLREVTQSYRLVDAALLARAALDRQEPTLERDASGGGRWRG